MTAILLSLALSWQLSQTPNEELAYIDSQYEWTVHEDNWCTYISTAVFYYCIIELSNEGISGSTDSILYLDMIRNKAPQVLEAWVKKGIIDRKPKDG